MQKIVKNIDRVLLAAIPLISIPLLVLFNCREFWLAALFFMLAVVSSILLQHLSLRFFHNIIPAIVGGTLAKLVIMTVLVFVAAQSGGYHQFKMIAAFLVAFLAAKIYEVKTLKYLTAQNSAKQEIKGC